jgi:hypothetical protein
MSETTEALAAEAIHRVRTLEEFRMLADELPVADRHPFFIALSDDDEIHRKLSGHRLDGHQRIPLHHLRPFGVGRSASDEHLLERCLFDEATFKGRRDPRIGLRDRHRVVHPVDDERLLGACEPHSVVPTS